ncbi:MAG: hypothetical protein ACR2NZ_05665 [Rubripirellula sp.]
MSSHSRLSIDLDLEDFRRLGVRPHECRLTVIRRAAARSSRALAEKQLNAPSDQAALQLSRVTTSAYRLLDPRQRPDSSQRTHIGRILPNVLNWAGQTSFHSQSSYPNSAERPRVTSGRGVDARPSDAGQGDVDSSESRMEADRAFAGSSLTDTEMVELMELDSTPLLAGQPAWTHSLHDGDLLGKSPLSRRLSRWSRRLRHPWSLLAVGGLCIGTLLGVYALWSESRQSEAIPEGSTASAALPMSPNADLDVVKPTVPEATVPDPRDANSANAESAGPESAGPESAGPALSDANELHETAGEQSENSSLMDELSVNNSEPAIVVDGQPVFDLANPLDADVADMGDAVATGLTAGSRLDPDVVERLMKDVVKPEVADTDTLQPSVDLGTMSLGGDEKVTSTGREPFLPDPFATGAPKEPVVSSDRSPEAPKLADIMLPTIDSQLERSQDPGSDSAEKLQPKIPVPDKKQVTAARTQLRMLVPGLGKNVSVSAVPDLIEELETIQGDLDRGSAEYWTSCLMIAELAWLTEDAESIETRVGSLVSKYDAEPHLLVAEAFVLAAKPALLPSEQTHLVEAGFLFVDDLMTNEQVLLARSVVEALEPLAESLEAAVVIKYVDRYSDTLDQMTRLKETSSRAMNANGELVDSASKGIVGRYYCLMLRRWDKGLQWLTSASDPRVAGVARQEVALADDASADELGEVAKRWFAASSRATGIASDSMSLHAIALLRQAKTNATALEKLQLDEEIDEAIQAFPPFLRTVARRESLTAKERSDASGSRPSDTGSNTKPSTDKTAASTGRVFDDGLSGVIRVDKKNIGVQLNYELEVPVTLTLIGQIGERLGVDLKQYSMEFAGEISLDQPTTVKVAIASVQQGVVQKLRVNDKLVDIDPLEGLGELTLPAGKHPLTWSVEVQGPINRVFLRLTNAASGERLAVKPEGFARGSVFTVDMLRGPQE